MNYDEKYEKAEEYYFNSEYEKALRLFTQLNSSKESNDCLNYIGCCKIALNKFNDAESIFIDLLKRAPNWERPMFNLGRVYLKLGKEEMAFQCLHKAVQINPENEDAFFYLGVFHLEKGRYKMAERYFKKSLKIQFNQPETHQKLGECYLEEKQYEKALEEFCVSSSQDSNDNDVYFDIGLTYLYMKRYKKALEVFLNLSLKEPKDIACIKNIVRCYHNLGDIENAATWNNKLLEIKPDYPKAIELAERFQMEIDLKKNKVEWGKKSI